MLLLAATHFESQITPSPSLVAGVFSYQHYALMADLLSSCILSDDAESEKFLIPPQQLVPTRAAFLQIARILAQSSLNVCED
ncbi:hypothetical protein HDU91_003239, partial [Kappamyces sp. JEL0680]